MSCRPRISNRTPWRFDDTGYTVMVWQRWYETEEEHLYARNRWLTGIKDAAYDEGVADSMGARLQGFLDELNVGGNRD